MVRGVKRRDSSSTNEIIDICFARPSAERFPTTGFKRIYKKGFPKWFCKHIQELNFKAVFLFSPALRLRLTGGPVLAIRLSLTDSGRFHTEMAPGVAFI